MTSRVFALIVLSLNAGWIVATPGLSLPLLLSQAPAQAQSAEDVAKKAQAITVRIEGATQGSGVLVKREGNRYTVLTAWHVVSGEKPGEEVDIYTPDGQRHPIDQGSIRRVGDVDMAVVTFTSANSYGVAALGDAKSISMGSQIFVAGFPLKTEAVNARVLRFLKGDVVANVTVGIANGYQLLYSNPTLPGMSGGAVLDDRGQLIGIHGQGETDVKLSEQQGVAVKTGTNQGVPVWFYQASILPAIQKESPSAGLQIPVNSSGGIPLGGRPSVDKPQDPLIPDGFAPQGKRDLPGGQPADPAKMSLLTRIAAINTCIYRNAGVNFDKAVGIAGETIAQVLLGQHKGLIQKVGTRPLTIEELRKGAINSAVIGAYELCPKLVPDDVVSKVKAALSR